MYVIKYRYHDCENVYQDEHMELEQAYKQFASYTYRDCYEYCELFKLVPIEVELKAVEKV